MIQALKNEIEEQGLTYEAASLRCGLDRSYFRTLFSREGASPRGVTLRKIADGLGITFNSVGEIVKAKRKPEAQVGADFRLAPHTVPTMNSMANDVPVLGTAAGSHIKGAFRLSSDPVDYVRRPPSLVGAKDVYALYIEGSSMEPQYHPGDLVFVHPHKPARFGDVVVIQCQNGQHDEIEATIGVYKSRTAEHIVIQKHKPPAEIEILRSTVVVLHKVLSMNEIYGV